MIGYASRTGTATTIAAMRAAGWRMLVSATGVLRTEGLPYALDNGAWTAYQQGRPFDERLFSVALRKLGRDADWTVVPDIVAGGMPSLELSLRWMRHVLDECGRGLLAVQDGIEVDDVRHLIGPRVGVFVGGSTPWKLATMARWAQLARERGAWCHVGRVNSMRRIRLCAIADVDSFDGTSVTKYPKTLRPLDRAVRRANANPYLPGVR